MLSLSHNAWWVLISTLLLGIAAGVVGVLSYWRKQSLMSDTIAHAALPGVVIGFLIVSSKQLPIMLLGAAITGLLGAWLVQYISSSTRVKPDTSMGIVLSVFFGVGIMLLTYANRLPGGGQSGLDGFIFGQAATMVSSDVKVLVSLAITVILIVLLLSKEWKLFLFDPNFAQGIGLSNKKMSYLYTILLVVVIIIGIQAVGVILIAALMIIPSVSARYWSESLYGMLVISALIGGGSSIIGTYISIMGNGLPTGPIIVVTAATIFIASLLFGTSKGLITLTLYRRQMVKRYEPMQEIEGVKQ